MTIDEAYNIIQTLPIPDRHTLLSRLIHDLDREDSAHDSDAQQAWAKEIEDRIDAYDRGELQAKPWRQVMAELRSSLRRDAQQ
jgi:putative addiction module component (TIGR02574 family)